MYNYVYLKYIDIVSSYHNSSPLNVSFEDLL